MTEHAIVDAPGDLTALPDRFSRALAASDRLYDYLALLQSGDEDPRAAGRTVEDLWLLTDLHKELNTLQALTANEEIDGAFASGLDAGDRALAAAFMTGLNTAARLAVDHPGRGTTVTRVGDRLLIQNEIDAAGAHLVIRVKDRTFTLIYTDVHPRRATLLRDIPAPYPVQWRDVDAPGGARGRMSIGRFVARSGEECERYLAFLGSRLVFLIDWERAYDCLSRLVDSDDASALLVWAAANGVDCVGFLRMNGPDQIAQAIQAARPGAAHGARLDGLLGRVAARTFLMSVLRLTSVSGPAGRPSARLRDEIEAELWRQLPPRDHAFLSAAGEHAAYIFALGERLRRAFAHAGAGDSDTVRTAALAGTWESRADAIVQRCARLSLSAAASRRPFADLLCAADSAADGLEEIAFLLALVPDEHAAVWLPLFGAVPDLVVRSAKEYIRTLALAEQRADAGAPPVVDGSGAAMDCFAALEDEIAAAEARLVQNATSFRELHVLSRIVRNFEKTGHALARSAALVARHLRGEGGES